MSSSIIILYFVLMIEFDFNINEANFEVEKKVYSGIFNGESGFFPPQGLIQKVWVRQCFMAGRLRL